MYIYFPAILFKSTENVAYGSGNGNNHDITNISKMPNFVIMDYDEKYITGYILGDWKDAENVIQEYQAFTNNADIVEENIVHLTLATEVNF